MSRIREFIVVLQRQSLLNNILLGLSIVVLALLAWRIWTFTVVPYLSPRRPRTLPYWIPGLGHVVTYAIDYNAVLEQGREFVKDSKEPYTVILAGKRLYVVTSPEDNHQLYRNTTTVSRDSFVRNMMLSVGISDNGVSKMHASLPFHIDVKAANSIEASLQYHNRQLLPGSNEFEWLLEEKLIPGLNDALTLEYLKKHSSGQDVADGRIKVSLWDMCEKIFIRDTGDAFFGKGLWKDNPDLLESFTVWERKNWKFLYGMPKFLSHDMLSARDNIVAHYVRYFNIPAQERTDASYYVKVTENMLRDIGCSDHDIASMFMLHFWAALGNVYKLAFWVTAYLVHNPGLLESIRAEVLPAATGTQVDERYISEKCPKLDSLINEVLRLYATSGLIREVITPTVVGSKTLETNSMVLVPYHELHLDNDTWGDSPLAFDAERFYEDPKLQKSRAFRPFGGGTQLCPGRIVARRTVGYFVSLLVTRFEVAVDHSSSKFPRADLAKPAAGIPLPQEGDDVVLLLRERGKKKY